MPILRPTREAHHGLNARTALATLAASATLLLAAAAPRLAVAADAPATASAPDQIVGVVPKSRTKLKLYTTPNDAQPSAEVVVAELKLPLDILAHDSDFLKVQLSGKTVWVDGADVVIHKAVAFRCDPKTKGQTPKDPVASIPGASSSCK